MKHFISTLIIGLLACTANAQEVSIGNGQVSIGIEINGETFSYNANNLSRIYDAILKNPPEVKSSALKAVADSYFVGNLYFEWFQTDEKCEKNMDKAFKLYSLLSQGNYEPKDMYHAQMRLGSMYIQGLGIPKDIKKGFAKYMAAATEGNTDAQIFIARSYLTGEYSMQDFQQANFWFTKAAGLTDGDQSSRNGYACYMLGCAYYDGSPLANGKVDYAKAIEYLIINLRYIQRHYGDIVENGSTEYKRECADICRKLSACARFGRGVEKNEEWANEVMQMAAELGDPKAKMWADFLKEKPTLY